MKQNEAVRSCSEFEYTNDSMFKSNWCQDLSYVIHHLCLKDWLPIKGSLTCFFFSFWRREIIK